MDTTWEYKFVRLGDYRGSAWFGASDKARNAYEEVVHEQARDGWRLVQIFAPGVAAFGAAKYYELIFERERAQDATAAIGTQSAAEQHRHGPPLAHGYLLLWCSDSSSRRQSSSSTRAVISRSVRPIRPASRLIQAACRRSVAE